MVHCSKVRYIYASRTLYFKVSENKKHSFTLQLFRYFWCVCRLQKIPRKILLFCCFVCIKQTRQLFVFLVKKEAILSILGLTRALITFQKTSEKSNENLNCVQIVNGDLTEYLLLPSPCSVTIEQGQIHNPRIKT